MSPEPRYCVASTAWRTTLYVLCVLCVLCDLCGKVVAGLTLTQLAGSDRSYMCGRGRSLLQSRLA